MNTDKKNPFPNLNPALVKEITTLEKETSALPSVIVSEAQFKLIGALQSRAHVIIKDIEDWYDKKTKPLLAVVKDLREEKKAILAKPESWNATAQRLLAAWNFKQEALAEKERLLLQKKLDAEAEAARKREISALKKTDKTAAAELALVPVVAPLAEVPNTASLDGKSFRDELDVEVLDINLVPDEFIKKDLRLAEVKAAYKSGVRDIPGLRLTPTRILVNAAAWRQRGA